MAKNSQKSVNFDENSQEIESYELSASEKIERGKKLHSNSAKTPIDIFKRQKSRRNAALHEGDEFESGENGEIHGFESDFEGESGDLKNDKNGKIHAAKNGEFNAAKNGEKAQNSDFEKGEKGEKIHAKKDKKPEILTLKNGAFFISDAHANADRQGFLEFLRALNEGKIKTPQLIVMGDMFDIFVGEISSTHAFAKPYVDALESIAAQGIQVLYLEGNHDFNLARFFDGVQVFALKEQPLSLKCPKSLQLKKAIFAKGALKFDEERAEFKGISCLLLAHGDIFLPFFLGLALRFLRTPFLLKTLNFIDKIALGALSKKVKNEQAAKNLFYAIDEFKQIASARYAKYDKKGALVVEGHYHQDAFFSTRHLKYVNLPAFAKDSGVFVAEFE